MDVIGVFKQIAVAFDTARDGTDTDKLAALVEARRIIGEVRDDPRFDPRLVAMFEASFARLEAAGAVGPVRQH